MTLQQFFPLFRAGWALRQPKRVFHFKNHVKLSTVSPVNAFGAPSRMSSTAKTNKVPILVLGAGFVARPCIEYLLRHPSNHITVAATNLEEAERILAKLPKDLKERTTATTVDASNHSELQSLVVEHELAISLIPYVFHPSVIKACIAGKVNMVSTSYISPKMSALHDRAREVGITVLNEIGFDPGYDHLLALRMVDQVHARGGQVLGFESYCGGLPAPECSDNFLGYKFSWSAAGVLMALGNGARWLEDGNMKTIGGGADLMNIAKEIDCGLKGMVFEGYPNRDSTGYRERYGIPEAKTVIRGTLRYRGFSILMGAYARLGMLDGSTKIDATNWLQALRMLVGTTSDASREQVIEGCLRMSGLQDKQDQQRFIESLDWLGMLSEATPFGKGSLRDEFCVLLMRHMQYSPAERDMTILQHRFDVSYPKEDKRSVITCRSLAFAHPDAHAKAPGAYMAMEKMVGLPCGIAAQMVLDGRIQSGLGVVAPLDKGMIDSLLDELEKNGIISKDEEREIVD